GLQGIGVDHRIGISRRDGVCRHIPDVAVVMGWQTGAGIRHRERNLRMAETLYYRQPTLACGDMQRRYRWRFRDQVTDPVARRQAVGIDRPMTAAHRVTER